MNIDEAFHIQQPLQNPAIVISHFFGTHEIILASGEMKPSTVTCLLCGAEIDHGQRAILDNCWDDKMVAGAFCSEHTFEEIAQTVMEKAPEILRERADEIAALDPTALITREKSDQDYARPPNYL